MNVTAELREYALGWDDRNRVHRELCDIADHIEATVTSQLFDANCAGYMRAVDEFCDKSMHLPVDADGVPIRPGDELVIFETGEHIRAYDIELYDDGRWLVCDDETMDSINPDRLRHHHTPTVEDVLREFAECVRDQNADFTALLVNEYAAKLRLAGEE